MQLVAVHAAAGRKRDRPTAAVALSPAQQSSQKVAASAVCGMIGRADVCFLKGEIRDSEAMP
jgi:hypothetical protein